MLRGVGKAGLVGKERWGKAGVVGWWVGGWGPVQETRERKRVGRREGWGIVGGWGGSGGQDSTQLHILGLSDLLFSI